MKLVYGAVCLVIASAILYWVKKRQFDRTNQYGAEQFGSYRSKLVASTTEQLATKFALGLLVLGALLVVI